MSSSPLKAKATIRLNWKTTRADAVIELPFLEPKMKFKRNVIYNFLTVKTDVKTDVKPDGFLILKANKHNTDF